MRVPLSRLLHEHLKQLEPQGSLCEPNFLWESLLNYELLLIDFNIILTQLDHVTSSLPFKRLFSMN